METRNATIREADIIIEDHGILTEQIQFDYGGSVQGLGHYGGFEHDENGALFGKFIRALLDTLEARSLSDLVGKPCRVRIGNDRLIDSVGHFTKEKWFCPKDICERKYHG